MHSVDGNNVPDPEGTAFSSHRPGVKTKRMKWLRIGQVLFTLVAITFILVSIQWRDHAELVNGTQVIVEDRQGDFVTVSTPDYPREPDRTIKSSDIKLLEPGLVSLLISMQPAWLVGYFALASAIAMLLSLRWWLLLQIDSSYPGFFWCAVIWARSQVVAALPTSQIGGDIYRIERSRHWAATDGIAAAVVAAERVIGFSALIAMGLTGLAISGLNAHWPILGLSVGSATLFCMLCVGTRINGNVGGQSNPQDSQRLTHEAGIFQRCVFLARRFTVHPSLVAGTFALSLCIQILAPLTFFVIDRALDLDTPVWCYMVAVPVISIAQYLPIHISGIGVLEGGLWVLLSRLNGTTFSQIICLSAAARIMGLCWLAILAIASLFALNGHGDIANPRASNKVANRREIAGHQPDMEAIM